MYILNSVKAEYLLFWDLTVMPLIGLKSPPVLDEYGRVAAADMGLDFFV
jgi:hypothetical protein